MYTKLIAVAVLFGLNACAAAATPLRPLKDMGSSSHELDNLKTPHTISHRHRLSYEAPITGQGPAIDSTKRDIPFPASARDSLRIVLRHNAVRPHVMNQLAAPSGFRKFIRRNTGESASPSSAATLISDTVALAASATATTALHGHRHQKRFFALLLRGLIEGIKHGIKAGLKHAAKHAKNIGSRVKNTFRKSRSRSGSKAQAGKHVSQKTGKEAGKEGADHAREHIRNHHG